MNITQYEGATALLEEMERTNEAVENLTKKTVGNLVTRYNTEEDNEIKNFIEAQRELLKKHIVSTYEQFYTQLQKKLESL